MTLKFNRILAVVEKHVRAKFQQAECSGSWVIAVTKKKLRRKQYYRSLRRPVIKQDHQALIKAKYCPRAAAVSRTQKTQKNSCDLDL